MEKWTSIEALTAGVAMPHLFSLFSSQPEANSGGHHKMSADLLSLAPDVSR